MRQNSHQVNVARTHLRRTLQSTRFENINDFIPDIFSQAETNLRPSIVDEPSSPTPSPYTRKSNRPTSRDNKMYYYFEDKFTQPPSSPPSGLSSNKPSGLSSVRPSNAPSPFASTSPTQIESYKPSSNPTSPWGVSNSFQLNINSTLSESSADSPVERTNFNSLFGPIFGACVVFLILSIIIFHWFCECTMENVGDEGLSIAKDTFASSRESFDSEDPNYSQSAHMSQSSYAHSNQNEPRIYTRTQRQSRRPHR